MNMDLDGKELVESLITARLDKQTQKVLAIFKKHGIDTLTAMGMLTELAAALQNGEGEE